jgi:hypothetical protein
MSEPSHKAAMITALGAIIAALIGAAAAVYVHESRKPDKLDPETSGTGIYLHIQNNNQVALANQIKARLEAAGYNVPGIRRVDKGFNRTKVKYFRNNEEDGADSLVNLLHSWGVRDAEKALVGNYATDPRHYEIWFGQITSTTNSPQPEK